MGAARHLQLNRNQLFPSQILCFLRELTSVENLLEILEDLIDFRSLLRFAVPTLLRDLPDCF